MKKSDNFDQLLLLIESGIKALEQRKTITEINDDLEKANQDLEKAHFEVIK